MIGVGLYIEENLQEILARFHTAVTHELKVREPALRLAAPILLQDLARAFRGEQCGAEPWSRAVMLVMSQPEGGIRGLVREFGLLRRALWETLSERGHAVVAQERRTVDWMLDEALALSTERWAQLVRLLPAKRDRQPDVHPHPSSPAQPRGGTPPLPPRRRSVPPPLPPRSKPSQPPQR